MYKCKLCDRKFEKRHAFIAHCKVHSKKYIEKAKLKLIQNKKKRIPWNKGLSKETDERVKNYSKTLKDVYKGRPGTFKGKKHSEETKKKLSEIRIKHLQEHPDQVPYLLNHSSTMSYPEKIFKQALEENNIENWTYNYQVSLYSYDFAFPDLKIDVEIDGGTHETENVKKIDERRDKFSVDNGWFVVRFTAKQVKINVKECIDRLKVIIEQRDRNSVV